MADKHFVLLYDYVPDIVEKRGPYRAGHLGLANEFVKRGEIVLGGAFTDAPQGMLIFKGEDAGVVQRFIDADPYRAAGLVTGYTVREWTTVVGEGALTKVVLS